MLLMNHEEHNKSVLSILSWTNTIKPKNNAYVLVKLIDGMVTMATYSASTDSFEPVYVKLVEQPYDHHYAPYDQPETPDWPIEFTDAPVAWALLPSDFAEDNNND